MHGMLKQSRKSTNQADRDDKRSSRQANHARHEMLQQARHRELLQDGGMPIRGSHRVYALLA